MRKEDIQEYLSDEALEALIRETEEGPMIKAPEYLEENILHKIEQQQKVIVYKEKVSAKRKLLTYSMKVMVAAAAAIAFLIVVPTVEQQSRPNMETYVAEAKEQVNKDLQEQKEKAKKRAFARKPQQGREWKGNDRIKMKTLGKEAISINRETIDLRYVEQITDSEQVTALGYCVKYAQRHLLDGTRTLQEVVAMLEEKIEKESLAALCESTSSVASLARPRTQEIFACFDRYRGLKL